MNKDEGYGLSDTNGNEQTQIEELCRRRWVSHEGGGEEHINSQHEKGKMTAHERIEYFLDDETFREIDPFVEYQ